VSVVGNGQMESRAEPCPRCQPTPVAVGLTEMFEGKTWKDFDLRLNPKMKPALQACQALARRDAGAWCVLMVGKVGVGKSLLAAIALNESQWPKPGYFWEFGALCLNLRHLAFDDKGPQIPEETLLQRWREGRFMLVLDDVGAEKMTEWTAQTLYSIVNGRYQSQAPTIITTNNADSIEERVASRMFSGLVMCDGEDVRRLKANRWIS
jgi:DNA replication protein DnaC